MQLPKLLEELARCPLIASVQASEGSPLEDPEMLLRLAQTSLIEGVRVLRLQGVDTIRRVQQELRAPIIGLIKRSYDNCEIYITPTGKEVAELLSTECGVIALDGTPRKRPNDEELGELIAQIHEGGKLALADCDSLSSVRYAIDCGVDLVSTTLAGYTPDSVSTDGPDLALLRAAVSESSVPVLAEGRFQRPSQAQAAMRIGAAGVVVGGALNDPIKTTRAFAHAVQGPKGSVGAVDIGGTWLRFAVFSDEWDLVHVERVELPPTQREREGWIKSQVKNSGISRLGVGTGGTVNPSNGMVVEAKAIIPDHVGSIFHESIYEIPTTALNDGLATAWGHACHPNYAGSKVVTLALGTGVGCGFVDRQELQIGPYGAYPRINDLHPIPGKSFEEFLGGAALTSTPSGEEQLQAKFAAVRALTTLRAIYMPDFIVLCGGVGLSDWLDLTTEEVSDPLDHASKVWPKIVRSPFGADAGLYGAAALALFPPF